MRIGLAKSANFLRESSFWPQGAPQSPSGSLYTLTLRRALGLKESYALRQEPFFAFAVFQHVYVFGMCVLYVHLVHTHTCLTQTNQNKMQRQIVQTSTSKRLKQKKRLVTLCVTNRLNRGLISEDRSTKATLLFTIPRSCLSRLHRIYL